ncbi:hypothetical protein [Viridibacillus soli]|uniref:hypothetical protein n=1 Tax=Viridibacillus soli TaxID=2798301 RepID=UPI001F335A52|nr:hypothetical protein [Viridibacillus soli]
MDVVSLTTNKEIMPTLCEEYIASNALSIVQAQYEKTWITKAIEHDRKLIGFTSNRGDEETRRMQGNQFIH